MSKSCGSCVYFVKYKNQNSTGLCEKLDWSTKSDWGRTCPHWARKRYDRVQSKQLASNEINNEVKTNGPETT